MDTRLAIETIKHLHEFRPIPYINVDKRWAIGYGHTRTVRTGMEIDIQEAEQLLKDDLRVYAQSIKHIIKVPLNYYQFNALVVFCVHIGALLFEKSNLVRLLNLGWYEQVPAQLRRWSRKKNNTQKMRRQAEIDLWNTEKIEMEKAA